MAWPATDPIGRRVAKSPFPQAPNPESPISILPTSMIESVLQVVESGQDLSIEQMHETLGLVMEGRCGEEEIARLLLALHRKGETVDEVAGAALAMREKMRPIRTSRRGVIDTCGTGGDGSRTFNISTAAALVTAAAGVPVAKHGNRSITSRSGSADALAALGVNIQADVDRVEGCLDELGICFCFAPLLHEAMRHVAPVRKKLNVPTIFNILGPLANPAGAPFQLLGVGRAPLRSLMAQALTRLARNVLWSSTATTAWTRSPWAGSPTSPSRPGDGCGNSRGNRRISACPVVRARASWWRGRRRVRPSFKGCCGERKDRLARSCWPTRPRRSGPPGASRRSPPEWG